MKLALAFIVSALLSIGAVNSDRSADVPTIYVTNNSALAHEKVIEALPAFQAAVTEDFAPVWGQDARLEYIGDAKPPKGAWHIDLTDFPSCWSCAGYHEYRNGVVSAEVGVGLGSNWQVTFTHELFEILADPYPQDTLDGARLVVVGDDFFLLETADPVEADNLAYTREGRTGKPIKISDFITPRWFERGSKGPFDFARHCKRPLQVLRGGYQTIWRHGAWTSEENWNHLAEWVEGPDGWTWDED